MKKLILLPVFLLLISCEKALLDDNPANNPKANVESLYNAVGNKYSYFELKNINWDSVYQHYLPQVNDDMSKQELFNVLDSMLYDLRDGHVNLVSPFNLSRNWQWYLNYPDNFNPYVVERKYLGDDYRIAGGIRYTKLDSIGYIYYPSFGNGFTLQNLNEVFTFLQGTKGLIVDVRSNGGGSLNNAFALARRLVDKEQLALVTYEKTGPGPDDFGKGSGYNLSPSDGVNYEGKVAVLINRRSYSATNSFAGMLRGFDNVTIVGAQSGGGGGIPVDLELPNGWRYRFSATRSLIPVNEDEFYDIELGVIPELQAQTNELRLAQGVDDIIETAIIFLNN